MTAMVIIRVLDGKNLMEITNCSNEEAQEVLEARYFSELYNQEYVYDTSIRDGYGRIDGSNGEMIFSLIRLDDI